MTRIGAGLALFAVVNLAVALSGCRDRSATARAPLLILAPGSLMPPARIVDACSRTSLLQIKLRAGSVEDILIDAATFTGSGSGDEVVDVSFVRLYVDATMDGQVDSGDTPIGLASLCLAISPGIT